MSLILSHGITPSSELGILLARSHALIEAEKYADAIPFMVKAVALAPDNARILTDLGGLYVEAGRPSEALAPLQSAIALKPLMAIPHWRIGAALQALGDFDNAVEHLELAAEIRPNFADAHLRLGLLYREQGRESDALQAYRSASREAEDDGEKQVIDAQIARMEGRDEAAEAILRTALNRQPDLPAAHGALAKILSESGRFDDAAVHFEKQLDQTPYAGLCYYDLVRCKKAATVDERLLKRMQTVLESAALDDINRAVLLLARGKLMDDVGDYEKAMRDFDAAANLRSRTFDLDIVRFENEIVNIISLFSAHAISKLCSANAERAPIIIVGMPRSGTTLLEQIICSHPQVKGAGELAFWNSRLLRLIGEEPYALEENLLSTIAVEWRERVKKLSGVATHVTDKNPFNFLAIGLIHLVFPHASIIHCRRNPIDTALSIHQTHFSRSTNMPTGGKSLVRYFRAYQRLMAHWREVLPENRLLEVDYERLVATPNSEIRRVIEFIGLSWDASCLTPHVSNRLIKTPSGWQVRQSINAASVDRWRNYEPWLGPLAELHHNATANPIN